MLTDRLLSRVPPLCACLSAPLPVLPTDEKKCAKAPLSDSESPSSHVGCDDKTVAAAIDAPIRTSPNVPSSMPPPIVLPFTTPTADREFLEVRREPEQVDVSSANSFFEQLLHSMPPNFPFHASPVHLCRCSAMPGSHTHTMPKLARIPINMTQSVRPRDSESALDEYTATVAAATSPTNVPPANSASGVGDSVHMGTNVVGPHVNIGTDAVPTSDPSSSESDSVAEPKKMHVKVALPSVVVAPVPVSAAMAMAMAPVVVSPAKENHLDTPGELVAPSPSESEPISSSPTTPDDSHCTNSPPESESADASNSSPEAVKEEAATLPAAESSPPSASLACASAPLPLPSLPTPTALGVSSALLGAGAAAAAAAGLTQKKKKEYVADLSCQSQIECGELLPSSKRAMTAYVHFFGKEVEIYTATADPARQRLYRASALADKYGYATNKVGMYLARRRSAASGIFQATSFRAKPPGRTGLKAGGYFLTMDACVEFEHHFKQNDDCAALARAVQKAHAASVKREFSDEIEDSTDAAVRPNAAAIEAEASANLALLAQFSMPAHQSTSSTHSTVVDVLTPTKKRSAKEAQLDGYGLSSSLKMERTANNDDDSTRRIFQAIRTTTTGRLPVMPSHVLARPMHTRAVPIMTSEASASHSGFTPLSPLSTSATMSTPSPARTPTPLPALVGDNDVDVQQTKLEVSADDVKDEEARQRRADACVEKLRQQHQKQLEEDQQMQQQHAQYQHHLQQQQQHMQALAAQQQQQQHAAMLSSQPAGPHLYQFGPAPPHSFPSYPLAFSQPIHNPFDLTSQSAVASTGPTGFVSAHSPFMPMNPSVGMQIAPQTYSPYSSAILLSSPAHATGGGSATNLLSPSAFPYHPTAASSGLPLSMQHGQLQSVPVPHNQLQHGQPVNLNISYNISVSPTTAANMQLQAMQHAATGMNMTPQMPFGHTSMMVPFHTPATNMPHLQPHATQMQPTHLNNFSLMTPSAP